MRCCTCAAAFIVALPASTGFVGIKGIKHLHQLRAPMLSSRDSSVPPELSLQRAASGQGVCASPRNLLMVGGGEGKPLPSLPIPGAGCGESFELDRFVVGSLKGAINALFHKRDYARFYALETIARVPYFSYLCCLHLYETLGYWRQADYLKLHFAESYNELHHLLIMEALGGADRFLDRLLAQHVAFGYFFVATLLYLINPKAAYHLNQLVEEHAYSTYEAFLQSHGEELKRCPAPEVAVRYYGEDGLYLFNGVGPADHHSLGRDHEGGAGELGLERRSAERPAMATLYDVFVAVRDDEREHVKTMIYLQRELGKQGK